MTAAVPVVHGCVIKSLTAAGLQVAKALQCLDSLSVLDLPGQWRSADVTTASSPPCDTSQLYAHTLPEARYR